jgi:D-alanyl-D-alanine carboxypeptidase/D-alanyl-D-alanine-endopeptidase (penicillin-binding protein 4)
MKPGLAAWIVAAVLSGCAAAAPRDPRAEATAARIEAAAARFKMSGARAGVCVRRLSDGREVYLQRGSELFEIASNTKVVTTLAALWRLTPDYEFRTRVVANGPIENDTLKGSLVVIGGGDPSLSGRSSGDAMRVPREIAAAAQQAGIREIAGDLVMDDRFFDRVYRAPGWPAPESLWWYSAPVSALSFNDNCAEYKVGASPGVGGSAIITCAPVLAGLRVANQVTTVPRDQESEVRFERDPAGGVVVTGRIALGSSRSETLAVDDPALFFATAIKLQLERHGIVLRGTPRLVTAGEKLLPEAAELYACKSRLLDAVAVANRRSQNFYAEQILKTLGAVRHGKGTFENGLAAVREFTRAARMPEGAIVTTDGCGLSPGNQATPQALCALLEIAHRSALKEVFFASLAANGDADTTLRGRMTDKAMLGRIHAKTGTIKSNGVSALSGYAEGTDGDLYAFSILVNGARPERFAEARALEDAICYAIVGLTREAPRAK